MGETDPQNFTLYLEFGETDKKEIISSFILFLCTYASDYYYFKLFTFR